MIYFLGKPLFWLYYRVFFRLKVIGHENMPKTGGVVLCANHISANDTLVMGTANKRKIHFLAKKEVFKYKIFVPVLKALNGIPIDRSNPERHIIKHVISLLENGGIICIFAQGTRMDTIDPNDAKSGAAFFALKSGACIVPVKIESTYRFFSRITVTFGKPISMEEHAGKKLKSNLLSEVTNQVMNTIIDLT